MIAKSERGLKDKIELAERSAASLREEVGRTAEERAVAHAEAQLAEAQALFDQQVLDKQHQAQLDIVNVQREAAEQKEQAYRDVASARADVETQIADAQQREAERVARAQADAEAKVEDTAAIAAVLSRMQLAVEVQNMRMERRVDCRDRGIAS